MMTRKKRLTAFHGTGSSLSGGKRHRLKPVLQNLRFFARRDDFLGAAVVAGQRPSSVRHRLKPIPQGVAGLAVRLKFCGKGQNANMGAG
jgi:hypothetical protein